MPNLQVLDLSKNRINSLPYEIGQLKTLKVHSIRLFYNLAALQDLNLSENKLFFSPLTPELGKLNSLTKLDISNNQLDELPTELANLQVHNLETELSIAAEPPDTEHES